MPLTLPYPTFTNGTTTNAGKVAADFHAIADFLNTAKLDVGMLSDSNYRFQFEHSSNLRRTPALSGVVSLPTVARWKCPIAASELYFSAMCTFTAGPIAVSVLINGIAAATLNPAVSAQWIHVGVAIPIVLVAGDIVTIRVTAAAAVDLCEVAAVVRIQKELDSA